jgi:hypothetical protein
MADDVADYSGTSDSDGDVQSRVGSPPTGRLPAPAGSCIFAHRLSVLSLAVACRMRVRTIAGNEFDRRL